MAFGHPLFYSDSFFWGDLIQALLTPLFSPFFSPFLGAGVGSFLNVCLYRWKNGGQVVTPSSYCPKCKKTILPFDNIPVLSFLWLGGKCRFCHKPISIQYPLIEAVTALLFWISSVLFFKNSVFLVLTSYFFVSFLVLLSVSDLKWRLLPHVFNNLFILCGLGFSVKMIFNSPGNPFVSASSFLLLGSIMFILLQFFSNGLGGGDVKMVAGLGMWLGVFKATCVLTLASFGALLVMLGLYFMGRVDWRWKIPFGPFLAAGALGIWFMPSLIEQFRTMITRIG